MNQKPRVVYYDTETTGFRSDKDRVIEIAAYESTSQETFQKLINPGFPIPAEASAIHHITDEMVSHCPNFGGIAHEFVEFCGQDAILIAHNNDSFDKLFISAEFARHQITMPSWKFLDSLKWARRYRSDLPRHTLQFLREIYGIEKNNAHRALDDVMVLHQIFTSMTDDLNIEQVMQLLSKPQDIRTMPFGKHQGQPLASLPKSYIQWLASSGALDKPENQALKEALAQLS